jgi:4-amino-4-deoxy-L-arabinose transferase-like glycosyltransferase
MPTAELAAERPRAEATRERSSLRRAVAWPILATVLAIALALRLWGIGSGLPYVYNVDEAAHFVPRAVAMSSGGLDPHYFVNPPALTYLLHAVFVLAFGGGAGTIGEFANHRDTLFLLARVVVAVLGVLAVWLLYLLGARLFEDRRTGLLAAALEAVAFLPVFYGHFALADAPTLVPLTLSLLGSALILRCGRRRDHAIAGIGLGLACASKYTAGIVLLPLLAAAWLRHREDRGAGGEDGAVADAHAPERRSLALLALAGACAVGAFLLANPYALLDFHRFHADLAHQSALSDEAQGKLGAPRQGGVLYYLWSLTWGLGWIPALAALGGALAIWRRGARAGWLLVPPVLAFGVFMGLQSRYYGRWLLPIFPILCLLAAYFAIEAVRALPARVPPRAAAPLLVLGSVALLAQGALYSVHDDLILSRADTRASARAWMLAHIPRGARIVLEPIVREEWLQEHGPGPAVTHPPRWAKYAELGPLVSPDGRIASTAPRAHKIEDYELTLAPSLLSRYEQAGYCWVIGGSTQRGRAFADTRRARWAVAYYRDLERRAQLAYRVSPYARPSRRVSFSFDWSFDYYPLAYVRPGPEVTVYRLRGGRCAR